MKRPARTKPEEERARQVIEQTLQRPVIRHDDGSQSGMYDFRIGPAENPEVAIEVVTARDREVAELFSIGSSFNLKVNGDWLIWITRHARINALKKDLEPILRMAESQNLLALSVDYKLERNSAGFYQALNTLHITKIECFQMPGTGKVVPRLEPRGGIFDIGAQATSQWVGEFLRHDDRKDVLLKLQRSHAPQRHVFIPVDFSGAPEEVEYYLMRQVEEHLPSASPDLPSLVTDVWVISTKCGLRWDGTLWQRFEA